MKRNILILIILFLFVSMAVAAEKAKDVNQLFYKANSLYEKGEYQKATEAYIAILDTGLESGNIYYNIGNGFLKLGKLGYAILCYEKAKRLIPGDSDLKSNLSYARSMVEDSSSDAPPKSLFMRLLGKPFADFNLNFLTIILTILYLCAAAVLSIFILNPIFARKATLISLLVVLVFLASLAAFSLRYYNEEVLKHWVVVQNEVECKYEPVENATTYYKLSEGREVSVLETRNGWRRIRRFDGRIAWVKKEAVEEI